MTTGKRDLADHLALARRQRGQHLRDRDIVRAVRDWAEHEAARSLHAPARRTDLETVARVLHQELYVGL